jgi:hypothetical protein
LPGPGIVGLDWNLGGGGPVGTKTCALAGMKVAMQLRVPRIAARKIFFINATLQAK